MKKIVYSVYHDLRWEERSREVLEALQQFAEVYIITYADIPDKCKNKFTHPCIVKSVFKIPGSRYFNYVRETKKMIKKIKPDVVLLHDFPILISWLKKAFPSTKIVYDQSELVIDRKAKSIKTFGLSLIDRIEKRDVKKVDVYIAANQERADIAKKHFKLKNHIIVFDNMHRIDGTVDEKVCETKYAPLFAKSSFTIVYGGGIREDRGTFEIAAALKKLGADYNLIIVGNDWGNKQNFISYLKDNNITNVDYIGFIDRNEWGYLLKCSKASIVFFLQNTINNTYCASGKMYESLFLGKPIICSTNPPLKHLCDRFHCGVCSEDFASSIKNLKDNYEYYVDGAKSFIEATDYDGRINRLADSIQENV